MSEVTLLKERIKALEEELAEIKGTNTALKKQAFSNLLAEQKEHSCCDLLERVQRASTLKNDFMSNSGYEIRTSLNSIIGALDVLYSFAESDEQAEYVDMAASEAVRLLEHINRVLDIARIESGEIDIYLESFNLKEALDSDLYALSLDAHGREIEFSCDIDSDVPKSLRGDGHRLSQIVAGLVGDRILYTRDEGAVAVNVSTDGYDVQNRILLRFSVTDTGTPLVEKQFEALTTFMGRNLEASKSHPLAAGDASLGLVCAIQLAKIMGGTVGVESNEQGSTFWFSLPFEDAIATSQSIKDIEPSKQPFSVLQEKKILLAEDDMVNRILITKMLEQQGANVVAALDGKQAFECAQNEKFDLVLMDIQMPVMDGFEATRKIREHEKGSGVRTKIIALTAIADREKCLQAGMDDYLSKPIQKQEFFEMLGEYLTRSALVVDDNSESSGTIVQTLIEAGWRVTTAETSRQALYEASLGHFDAFFLNTDLPDFKGESVVEVLRKLEKYSGRRTVIVGLSSETKGSQASSHLDALVKRPLSQEQIQTTIDSFFSAESTATITQ